MKKKAPMHRQQRCPPHLALGRIGCQCGIPVVVSVLSYLYIILKACFSPQMDFKQLAYYIQLVLCYILYDFTHQSFSVYSVHFNSLRSNSVHLVYFGPLYMSNSVQVNSFGLLQSILSTLIQLSYMTGRESLWSLTAWL